LCQKKVEPGAGGDGGDGVLMQMRLPASLAAPGIRDAFGRTQEQILSDLSRPRHGSGMAVLLTGLRVFSIIQI